MALRSTSGNVHAERLFGNFGPWSSNDVSFDLFWDNRACNMNVGFKVFFVDSKGRHMDFVFGGV